MKKFRRIIASLLPVLLLLTFLTGNASAALQSVGPTDPVTTLPTWYMDTNNLALEPCNDQDTPYCILGPPFDAASVPRSTITTTGPITDLNFPGEGFYYSADASMPIEGGVETARLTYVLEFAFLGGVAPDTGVTFLRTDLVQLRNMPPNTFYRVTHPYGTFEVEIDSTGTSVNGGNAIRFEDQPGTVFNYLPPFFKSAPNTNIGPFLRNADGSFVDDVATGKRYIGDAVTPVLVTGGTNGNIFRIDRLTGSGGTPVPGASWQTDRFVLMGKVFTGQIPSPMTIDRTTYARAAGTGQVDIFATALPGATLKISGSGIATTNLTPDTPATGKFFLDIPLGSATLPTAVVLTNSLDIPPIPYPVTLVDEVNITMASFDPVSKKLTIKAASRDKVAPLPTLTAPQFAAPNTLDATGTVIVTLTNIPPENVIVQSSKGGQATAPLSVVNTPAAPVAVNDSATTVANTGVVINVLANDTTAGTIDRTSIVIASQPLSGAAVANPNGTVTFTPAASFTGTRTFTYTVKDILGQVSNAATVTVTVTPPPPVAPATAVTLTALPASPQQTGKVIDFVAAASGGTGSYEYEFWFFNGTVWTKVQAYSANALWIWNTAGVAPGSTYSIQVNARSAGSTSVLGEAKKAIPYQITATPTPATGVTLTPLPASPQTVGATVSFIAAGSGGSGTYEYEFWRSFNGGAFTKVQAYSANASLVWNTTGTATGSYAIQVNVRNAGSTSVTGEAKRTITYQINAVPAPAAAVALTIFPASPQTVGATVNFVAAASGGSGSYEYEYWRSFNGGTFTKVQAYSSNASWIWNTTGMATGTYSVQVNTRNIGSTSVTGEAKRTVSYVLNP